ncbi:carbohydrate porin [Plectonema cf. radiosum LEGE 06105]|uniref:Carbohydrate porin n=1 Tax=Plectonema cf. radiosum LEGE 06105 TaxID=945769 RepID=A0A8J7EZ86_9CYAN|nr:iron uptake porin [Plectonema radiosum]MBE9211395.1 carbohydrate porin [Plectonema cf. radiosum LEGE 06105]
MTKLFWNVFKLSPIVLAATFFAANSAFAGEVSEKSTSVAELSVESNNIGQVTSVSQFSDVQPTDWAFQALQSLVERYGCIAGYPNGTFRGNRALTRYEFAAGLNACLDRINELIAIATERVGSGDLETLKRLQEEYAAELATLRGRVDALESRSAKLEANQFSTTAKLKGEAIFAVAGAFGDSVDNDNVTLSNRVRLDFDSSFTGKDKLRVRLQARNTPEFDGDVTGTRMTRLGFDGEDGNNFELTELNYSFKPAKGVMVKIDANEADLNDNVNVFNPLLSSSGSGAISRYGRFSPIYRSASGDAGVTAVLGGKNSPIKLSGSYTSGNPSNTDNGFFNGSNAFLGQIEIQPIKALSIGATYVRRFDAGNPTDSDDLPDTNVTGSTGANGTRRPFGNVATKSNHYGVQAALQLNKTTTVGGWYGFVDADQENGAGDSEIQYWAATLGMKDFGAKGNTLGLIFGQPPKITQISNFGTATKDEDTSYHLEGLYKMSINDRISITPGLLVIFNPEHNNDNSTVYVGTLRTTFKF